MRKDPTRMTWLIRCKTPGDRQEVRRVLQENLSADSLFVDAVSFGPKDHPTVRETRYRFGDSFDRAEILPLADGAALQVTFHRRPDAPRFWKDLMVRALTLAEKAAEGTSVE